MGPDFDGKVIKERGKQRLAGIEPTTSRLQGKCSTAALQPRLRMLSQKQMHPTKKVREVVGSNPAGCWLFSLSTISFVHL